MTGEPLRSVPVDVHSGAALVSPITEPVKVVSRSPKTFR